MRVYGLQHSSTTVQCSTVGRHVQLSCRHARAYLHALHRSTCCDLCLSPCPSLSEMHTLVSLLVLPAPPPQLSHFTVENVGSHARVTLELQRVHTCDIFAVESHQLHRHCTIIGSQVATKGPPVNTDIFLETKTSPFSSTPCDDIVSFTPLPEKRTHTSSTLCRYFFFFSGRAHTYKLCIDIFRETNTRSTPSILND